MLSDNLVQDGKTVNLVEQLVPKSIIGAKRIYKHLTTIFNLKVVN